MTVKALNVVVYDLQPATTYEFRVKTRKQTAETTYSISAYNTTFESGMSDNSILSSYNDKVTTNALANFSTNFGPHHVDNPHD